VNDASFLKSRLNHGFNSNEAKQTKKFSEQVYENYDSHSAMAMILCDKLSAMSYDESQNLFNRIDTSDQNVIPQMQNNHKDSLEIFPPPELNLHTRQASQDCNAIMALSDQILRLGSNDQMKKVLYHMLLKNPEVFSELKNMMVDDPSRKLSNHTSTDNGGLTGHNFSSKSRICKGPIRKFTDFTISEIGHVTNMSEVGEKCPFDSQPRRDSPQESLKPRARKGKSSKPKVNIVTNFNFNSSSDRSRPASSPKASSKMTMQTKQTKNFILKMPTDQNSPSFNFQAEQQSA
jgi:hypothetical protein